MHAYRCYFLNIDGHIQAAEIIEAADIGAAVETARAMLRLRPHHAAIEVWDGSKRLYASEPSGADATG